MGSKKSAKSSAPAKEVSLTEQLLLLKKMNRKAFEAQSKKHIKELAKLLNQAIEAASARLETENSTKGMELIVVNPNYVETVPTETRQWDCYEVSLISEGERFAAATHGDVALVPELHALVVLSCHEQSVFGRGEVWSSVEAGSLVRLHIAQQINVENVVYFTSHDNSTDYADTIRRCVEEELIKPMVEWLDSLGVEDQMP